MIIQVVITCEPICATTLTPTINFCLQSFMVIILVFGKYPMKLLPKVFKTTTLGLEILLHKVTK